MRMRTTVTALLALVLIGSLSGCICPGSGNGEPIVPGSALVGSPIEVKLRAFVTDHHPWTGCYQPVNGRFKDVRIRYRLVGESEWQAREPDTVVEQCFSLMRPRSGAKIGLSVESETLSRRQLNAERTAARISVLFS
jgi:hypothetical protein